MSAENSTLTAIGKLKNWFSNQSWVQLGEHLIVIGGTIYVTKQILKEGVQNWASRQALDLLTMVPGGKALVEAEKQTIVKQIEDHILGENGESEETKNRTLPEIGIDRAVILDLLKEWRQKEVHFNLGRAFGGIYGRDHEHEAFVNAAYCLYCDSNALYPGVFPGLRKFEAEVVAMTLSLYRADLTQPRGACGTMTSGGTESVILAVKSNRDYYRQVKPHIRRPNIVVGVSAHAAFAKACEYLCVEIRLVPSGPESRYAVNPAEVAAAMDANTILIVGSAPGFPHGVIDPIPELGQLALARDVGLHVDCCLGGYIMPFLRQMGLVTVPFDFTVPGVTSISADLHKYGMGPKGSSIIMHSTDERRKAQFSGYTEWSGGLYCSPSMTGSRSGGIIAAAWATLMSIGVEGYLDHARKQYNTWQGLVTEIPQIPGLELIGPPDACVIAFRSIDPQVDTMKIADAMGRLHWQLNRLQKPIALQMQIGNRPDFVPREFLNDLAQSMEAIRKNPDDFKAGLAAAYTMAAEIPNRDLVGSILEDYMSLLYRV